MISAIRGVAQRDTSREQERTDDHRDQVGADERGDVAGVEPESVPVVRGGARKGAERGLGAEQADPDEPGGQLHRPHVGLPEHPEVDRRVGLPQFMSPEGQERERRRSR